MSGGVNAYKSAFRGATKMIPAATFQDIQAELSRLEGNDGIKILFAVESGSRAWGFPSTDSDYDVRFVSARQPWDDRFGHLA